MILPYYVRPGEHLLWECREIEHPSDVCEDQERGERLYRKFERPQFILPISLANSLAFAQLLGVILVPILASAAMGVEYGWGTLRTALTRGTGRWQLLVAKVVALMLLVVAGLLILSLTSVASSSIVGWLTLSDGLGFADSGKWSSAGVMFGKTVYSLVPYTLLALFFTVLTSSTGKGDRAGVGILLHRIVRGRRPFRAVRLVSPHFRLPAGTEHSWLESRGGPKLRRQAAWFKFHWHMCPVIYMPLWYC